MMRTAKAPTFVLLLTLMPLFAATAARSDLKVLGDGFPVSGPDTDFANGIDIAGFADGGYFAVWGSAGTIEGSRVLGRFLDSAGLPASDEIVISEFGLGGDRNPQVAVRDDGGFTVVWRDLPTSRFAGRSFDARGLAIGEEFVLPGFNPNSHPKVDLAALPGGDLVAVWSRAPSDPLLVKFSTNGALLGETELVPLDESSVLTFLEPKIGVDGAGNMVVAALNSSALLPFPTFNLMAVQIFNSDLERVDGDDSINDSRCTRAADPALAVNSSGSFLVTWQGCGPPPIDSAIVGRHFDLSTGPLADSGSNPPVTFRIDDGDGSVRNPAVAASLRGNFVVLWEDNRPAAPTSRGPSVYGRVIASTGEFSGPRIALDDLTTRSQKRAAAAFADTEAFE